MQRRFGRCRLGYGRPEQGDYPCLGRIIQEHRKQWRTSSPSFRNTMRLSIARVLVRQTPRFPLHNCRLGAQRRQKDCEAWVRAAPTVCTADGTRNVRVRSHGAKVSEAKPVRFARLGDGSIAGRMDAARISTLLAFGGGARAGPALNSQATPSSFPPWSLRLQRGSVFPWDIDGVEQRLRGSSECPPPPSQSRLGAVRLIA